MPSECGTKSAPEPANSSSNNFRPVESLSIEGLRVGTAAVELRLTRFGDGVSVDVARPPGRVEAEVIR